MCANLNARSHDYIRPGAGTSPLPFTPPRLHEKATGWYIDFRIFDPVVNGFRRKKYFLNKIKSIRERRKYAALLMAELNTKLLQGWSPWALPENDRGYTALETIFDRYKTTIDRMDGRKTRLGYYSHINRFNQYLKTLPLRPQYAYQITKPFIVGFLDWIYYDEGVSAITRNNYRDWCFHFCQFMVDRGHLHENPVATIKNLPRTEKVRKPLSPEELIQLKKYLQRTGNLHFYLACLFLYYGFIRPAEMIHIKLEDISIKECSLRISGSHAKNKKDAKVALNNDILRLLLDLKTFQSPDSYYLFGKGFRPSKKIGEPQQFRRFWEKIRKALHWPKSLQFYSLKNSGIRDLANKVGIVEARDQARHSDIAVTNEYLPRWNKISPEVQRFKGTLTYTDDDQSETS